MKAYKIEKGHDTYLYVCGGNVYPTVKTTQSEYDCAMNLQFHEHAHMNIGVINAPSIQLKVALSNVTSVIECDIEQYAMSAGLYIERKDSNGNMHWDTVSTTKIEYATPQSFMTWNIKS